MESLTADCLEPVAAPMEMTSTQAEGALSRRWYSIVESLLTKETMSTEEIQQLLSEAVVAARADDHWANSGMMELLDRARDSAMNGFADSARKAAIGLLDFHLVVEKYRMTVSGEGKKSQSGASSDAEDDHGMEVASAGTHSSGQEEGAQNLSVAADTTSDADNTVIYVAMDATTAGGDVNSGGSGRKRRRSSVEHKPQSVAVHLPQEATTTWSGAVRLQKGDETADMCMLDMQVPCSIMEELPQELLVHAIRQRRDITTKGQLACETMIRGANRQQLAQLRKMAQMELVAVVPLEDCGAILVPYLSKSGHVKAVTFLAALA